MASFGSQPLVTRPELVRWSLCAAVVLAAHGMAVVALAGRADEAELEGGAPVVTIELAPVAVAPPAPPRDLAAGPLLETESQERVADEAPAPPERKEPEKEKHAKVVEAPPAPDPEVAMAPEPPPEEGPIEHKPAPAAAPAAPVPTAPQSAPAPAKLAAAPAVGPVARPTAAVVANWERLLVAQLERHKRYPPQARGKVGEARLAFSIDRAGRVLESRIVHSSGSEALDQDALALIRRAAPLPPPPAGVPENRLSFMVPIRYH
ncbi:MAG TPA: TonB family protein [Xanthobacteraceae bacterium]|jgi:protein TonB|nr:TonB family protein [Xanthobacteraceae bacterium]